MAELEYSLLIIQHDPDVRDDLVSLFEGQMPQNLSPPDLLFSFQECVGNITIEMATEKGRQRASRKLFIHTAASAQDYRFHWRDHTHHAVLLDLSLPEQEHATPRRETGMKLLREIKRDHPATEVIVFTDQMIVDRAIEAIGEGAFYFVEKPHVYGEFIKALVARIIQMAEGAYLDPLTGLYNTRFFQSSLKNHWEECSSRRGDDRRERRGTLSLIMIDLDDFKSVNDTYGHPEGDAFLRFIAERIEESFRKTDVKGRVGGDEFSVILPSTDHRDALGRAERFREGVEREGIQLKGGTGADEKPRTISAGVASFPVPNRVSQLDEFVEAADNALLYAKKRIGRNSVCGYKADGEKGSYSQICGTG